MLLRPRETERRHSVTLSSSRIEPAPGP